MPLGEFLTLPFNVADMHISSLINQKSYERIEYVLHRHPFTFLPKILMFLVLFVVPPIIYILLQTLFPGLFLKETFYTIAILLGSLYYLSILLFFYEQFIVFYLDMWVITNDRIIDVEQLGLFSRTISELDLFRIQDVTSDVHGFFPTLLDYGTLTIKTASNNVHIVFYDIAHPNKLREHMIQLSHIDRKFHYPNITDDDD